MNMMDTRAKGQTSYDFDRVINRRGTQSEKWNVGENELPMWVADMDFEVAEPIRQALRQRVDHGIYGYSGISEDWYQAYISWWVSRHGWTIEHDWLIFTTGVVPAISSMVRKLTTPAEKVLLQTPVYNIFFNSILNNGRFPLESPLKLVDTGRADGRKEYRMDFDRLEADLSDPQVTLMILCNPQNPGGTIWSAEDLKRVAELCARHGVTVISDEIHGDLTEPGVGYVPFASVSPTASRISVTCLSPSKAFNIAGIHSAAVVVPDEHLRHKVWRGLNTDEIAEPNVFAVGAAVAAFNQGGEWLDALRCYISENRRFACDYISAQIPLIQPVHGEGTYLLWLDLRALPGHGEGFTDFLRQQTGLFITDGAHYGQGGSGFARMNLACPRGLVEDGLDRLRRGVKAYCQQR
ncbi:aminotransferase, class I/II [Parascardovia denticolens DSM 10105 = JCM 12538]|uniref:cysteine-S-conjugate beta-lyase n=1 Tax=Parascardovia denticolens DSM 10105 = JCM 12538 TaxID=864564 RepID=E6K1N8_PARDN|nr:aminotransferase, class I/II [Parascardovia denticolens DSM 10105 = JCM 12538]BAR05423.1 putative aminotransferase [Parascardovia denticolens DSM 10105 = JCM 12538]